MDLLTLSVQENQCMGEFYASHFLLSTMFCQHKQHVSIQLKWEPSLLQGHRTQGGDPINLPGLNISPLVDVKIPCFGDQLASVRLAGAKDLRAEAGCHTARDTLDHLYPFRIVDGALKGVFLRYSHCNHMIATAYFVSAGHTFQVT